MKIRELRAEQARQVVDVERRMAADILLPVKEARTGADPDW